MPIVRGEKKRRNNKAVSEYNSPQGHDYFLSRFARTIVSYLIAFERLFRTKQTKKEPACSVVEQAGVPID